MTKSVFCIRQNIPSQVTGCMTIQRWKNGREEQWNEFEKIIDNMDKVYWLHFSDCMNNGGTSRLFIDYSPSDKGVKGQIGYKM